MRSGRRDPRHTGEQGGRHKRATQSVATARGGERGSATLGGDGGDHRHRRHAPREADGATRRRARQEASQRTTVHVTQHLPSRPLLSSRRVVLCSAPAPPPGGSTTSDLRVVHQGRRAARKFGFSTFGAVPADFVWRSVWRCPTVAFSRRFPDLPLPGAPRSRGEIRRRGLRALERAHVSCGVDGAAPQQCSSRDPRGEKAVASSSRARCRCCRSWARSRLGSPDPPRASPRVPLAGYPSQLAPWVPWWCAPRRDPGIPAGKKMKKVKAKKRNKMRQVRSGNESPAVLPTSSFRRPATTRSPIDDVPPLASRVARRRRERPTPTPRR